MIQPVYYREKIEFEDEAEENPRNIHDFMPFSNFSTF